MQIAAAPARPLTFWAPRYFRNCEQRSRGLYVFAGANAARFGVGWNARGWEGEGSPVPGGRRKSGGGLRHANG